MIEKRRKGASVTVLDDTYLPVVITTFKGEVDLEMAHWHEAATARVIQPRIRAGLPVVYITDARAMQVPSATVRKYWADLVEERAAEMTAMLATIVILDSPIMRGALTAVQWMVKSSNRIHYVASLHKALVHANACLSQHNHPTVDLDAETYHVE